MKHEKKKVSLIHSLCFLLGIILLLTTLILKRNRVSQASFSNTNQKTVVAAVPDSVFIPSIKSNLTLEKSLIVNDTWQISRNTANYLLNSGQPQSGGNIIIYGHNTQDIFGRLNQVKEGDLIAIKDQHKQVYRYFVEEIKEINPDQIEYLYPTQEEVLTIYTCSGWFDQKRLLVQAKPVISSI